MCARHQIAIAVAFALLSSCGGENDVESFSLDLAASSYIGSAPVFVAQDRGYFRDHGLDVAMTVNTSGVASLQQLFRGEADIALVADLPVVYTRVNPTFYTEEEPGEIVVFADFFLSNNISHLLVRTDRGIRKPQDLIGKTVAAQKATSIDYLLDLFLETYRLNRSDIHLVDMDVTAQVQAIQRGVVDAIFSWEPHVGEAKMILGEMGRVLPLNLFYHNAWLAVTTRSFAEMNPNILEQFLRAVIDAESFLREAPEEAIDIHARHTGTDRDAVARSWNDVVFQVSLSEALLTTMDDEARWAIRSLSGTSPQIPNFLEHIETSPLNEINPERIRIIK